MTVEDHYMSEDVFSETMVFRVVLLFSTCCLPGVNLFVTHFTVCICVQMVVRIHCLRL